MMLQDLTDRSLGDPEHLANVLLARHGPAHTNDPVAQISWLLIISYEVEKDFVERKRLFTYIAHKRSHRDWQQNKRALYL